MNKNINTIIFDCFGVICGPVLNGWYRDHRLKKGLVDPNLKNIFESFDLGKLDENDIIDYFSKYEGVEKDLEKLRIEVDSYLSIDNDLVEMIKKFRNENFTTVLLSNVNALFFERKIYPTYPEFKSLFDEIIISSQVGMVKPYEEIYKYTLDKIGKQASETLFVDDSQANVDAALALGIQGYLYTDSPSFKKYINESDFNIKL